MELLPIIYWSLIGLGIITVIVIMISYITFKIRKKIGNIPSEEVKGAERNKKVKVTNPEKKSSQKKSHHPKVQTVSKKHKVEVAYKSSSSKSSSSTSSKGADIGYYKKPTRETKKRIEIVNDPKGNSDNPTKVQGINYQPMNTTPKRKGWN